jgi:hypothetical protein
MRNYSQNTQELAADLVNGIKCETSALSNLIYMTMSDVKVFDVIGRIKMNALYAEVVTTAGAQNTTLQFKYVQASPFVIGAVALGVTSVANINGALAGMRVTVIGDAVGTACLRDAVLGITAYTYPMILGTRTVGTTACVGSIVVDAAGAANLTGTTKYVIHYVPLSDGAYVSAVG